MVKKDFFVIILSLGLMVFSFWLIRSIFLSPKPHNKVQVNTVSAKPVEVSYPKDSGSFYETGQNHKKNLKSTKESFHQDELEKKHPPLRDLDRRLMETIGMEIPGEKSMDTLPTENKSGDPVVIA